ncbi:uncharacterized protein LOC121380170 [Gigantopelta aegis]|uniref:uncharacterized protein LOC121380170 n=1 Tax=Gigantopelta aegis TaxID=1735272 RepID=UPI001B888BE1|nr:uncharacterized protein LOC121380170 [Gigantopelta aegis]
MPRRFSLYGVQHLSLRSWILSIIVLSVITNEYLIYWLQSWRWPTLPVHERNPEREMVILLVSDPQIQGYQDESPFPLGMFTRWDIDRFLSRTFSLAFDYSQPDAVVFLGDLMDEGSKATTEEYQYTLSRFHNIFYPVENSVVIFIPGDNDIGGEGRDYRTPWKMSRYEESFGNISGLVNVGFVDFIKLDLQFHHEMPPYMLKLIAEVNQKSSAPIRIIINHDMLLPKMKFFIHPILRLVRPHLLLTGHWHEAIHFDCVDCMAENTDSSHWPVHRKDLYMKHYIDLDLSDPLAIHELMVPSCSYRMGKKDMGYGVLVIKPDGKMKFTVLWLPHRYTMLFYYLYLSSVLAVIATCVWVYKYLRTVRHLSR